MSKKARITLSLILVLVALANIGIFYKMSYNKTTPTGERIVIRLGHTVGDTHPIHQASVMFEEELERLSNNRFDVRVYPNAALGGDRQQTESMILGYIQANIPPTSVLAGFDERFMVVDLPFIFKTTEAAVNTLNGELGEELDPILESLGIHTMGWTSSGFRHITTNDIEVTSPKNLENVSIRTQENPIHLASFRAWGASPTPMAFSELFTALQQGAVAAQENPVLVTVSNRLFEVQNTLSLTGHFFTAGNFAFNKDFYDSLEGQDKAWLEAAGENFVDNLTRLVTEQDDDFIQQAEDNGMKIIRLTPEQKDEFIQSASSVYDLFIDEYGGSQELIDKAMLYNDESTED